MIEIEKRLELAKQRLSRAPFSMRPKFAGSEREEFESAYSAVFEIERELAAAKGESYAVPFGFPIQWDVGAPMPEVAATDSHAQLTFRVRRPEPVWDKQLMMFNTGENAWEDTTTVVDFERCVSARLGTPNDEVLHGHPLWGRGLDPYTAQIVMNSKLIAELEAMNSVHDCYDPERWRRLNHYIFWFHDCTFECVAESYNVELFRDGKRVLLPQLLGSCSE